LKQGDPLVDETDRTYFRGIDAAASLKHVIVNRLPHVHHISAASMPRPH
jgi:hypothetical protein